MQEQLEGLMDRMEAIEVMNKKHAKKNRDSEIKLALEDIKSQGAKKEVRPVECLSCKDGIVLSSFGR